MKYSTKKVWDQWKNDHEDVHLETVSDPVKRLVTIKMFKYQTVVSKVIFDEAFENIGAHDTEKMLNKMLAAFKQKEQETKEDA